MVKVSVWIDFVVHVMLFLASLEACRHSLPEKVIKGGLAMSDRQYGL
jgi:hypothetical protein